MSHTFDVQSVSSILADIERLVTRAIEHEHELTRLVNRLEGGVLAPGAVGATPGMAPSLVGFDWLGDVRRACVAARDQRLAVEAVLMRLIGDVRVTEPSRRPRVLIVDDTPDNVDLAVVIAEGGGFDAVTARNGFEGVLAAHAVHPTVVLMDLTMPILDGFAATRLLRTSAATKNVPVVAFTAQPEACKGPLGALFSDVLPKPVNPDAMLATLRRYR